MPPLIYSDGPKDGSNDSREALPVAIAGSITERISALAEPLLDSIAQLALVE